jgi:hypothetical protein
MKKTINCRQLLPIAKYQSGKSYFFIVLLLTATLFNFGCKKTTIESKTDDYYVKYKVNSPSTYSAKKLSITIQNEKNQPLTIVVNQNTSTENIIGPVAKGFNSKLKAVAVGETANQLKLYTEIQVCKNSGPFALKAINGSESPRDSVELSYTIDF